MPAFHRFDPAPCGFPTPRVPVLPALHARSLRLAGNVPKQDARWYRRGRYALAQAYRLSGVGREGALLAPAYHCRTMLDPAMALGADVRLYPVGQDLTPDLAALQALLPGRGVPVRALLVPHYFGFLQELAELAALCSRHGVHLIEDCSHLLAGASQSGVTPVPGGGTGHYAVASPYKFFPAPDGGLLWSNVGALPPAPTRPPGAAREARALAGAIGQVLGRRDAPSTDRLDEEVSHAPAPTRSGCADAREWIADETAPSALYDRAEEGIGSLALTRWIVRHTDLPRLASRRRAHYGQWLQAVRGLPGCRPLFPVLPDRCVPYMFPLCIDRPQSDFAVLKRLGVPIWRWDEMAVSGCAVAAAYRLRVLHLPCHQELTPQDMAWMTAAVAAVCGRRSGAGDADVH